MTGDLAVVERWLTAVNGADSEQLEALTTEQVEIVGPRGRGLMDRGVLGEWLSRAGFTSDPVRWFCGGDGRVVVEQAAQWRNVDSCAAQDHRTIGAEFTVRNGQVARFVRHDAGVSAALAAAGLDEHRDAVRRRT